MNLAAGGEDTMTDLSVVLISRNQEWNIARLVESVLKETDSLPSREVILVDSASTDQTTEIAARYPIRVLKLHADQRLSAAAGRCVGYKQTSGDLVLFLDGDMELCHGWLDQAIAVMRSMPDVAAVCGQVVDRPKDVETAQAEPAAFMTGAAAEMSPVRHGGGASLYRRSVLEQVGTFNPYLYSDEEPELCLRIRKAGHRILRIHRPIAYHYTVPWEAVSTFLEKRKSKIWLGYGQNVRYYLGSPLLWPYLKERGWAVAPALALLVGVIALVASVVTGRWTWLALWAGLLVMLVIAIAVRKGSLERALLILFRRLLILDGTIRGFLLKPYDPAGYPGKFDVIR